MKKINLIPGSPEWLQSRSASKAPAMMGVSNYQTRNELIFQMATGITKDVDAATQARFDNGHKTEALSRVIAEEVIGDDLLPISASDDDGYLTANYDGITFSSDVGYEHKDWNEKLAASVRNGVVPNSHAWQLDQQILVGNLDYVLFVVSDGTKDNFASVEYRSTKERAEALMSGWRQFDIDRENYQHVEHIEKPIAAPTIGLPALFAQVEGKFNLSTNIVSFASELKAFVGRMDLSPTDDQGFADLEAQVKVCAQAEDSIKAQVLGARGQMVSFDEFCKTAELLLAIASRARIDGTNAMKDKKVAIKAKAIADAKALFADHVAGLEAEISPIRLIVEQPDFITATKGLKGLKSLHNEIDTALANGKIKADAAAKDIRVKLKWHEANFAYRFLFNDLAQIIAKPFDDFTLTVKSRIAEHQQAEAAKEEEQRVAIQAAATAKAEREAAEKLAEAEAKLRAAQAEEDALVDSIWKQARRVEGDSVQYVNKAIVQFETVAKAWESDPRPRVASAIADARQQLAEKLRAADERAKAEQEAADLAKQNREYLTKLAETANKNGGFPTSAEAATIKERRKQAQLDAQAQPFKLSGAKTVVAQSIAPRRPNRAELLDAVATAFGTTNEAALDWIIQEFRGDIQHEARKAA